MPSHLVEGLAAELIWRPLCETTPICESLGRVYPEEVRQEAIPDIICRAMIVLLTL